MLQIGITGGIGSGKTTVCKIFASMGIPIYYADDRAKQLMITKPGIVVQIKELFGNKAYLPDGQLNRPYISQKVFKNKKLLQALNGIVHPAVHQDGYEWHQAQKNVPYTMKEAALIFESGNHMMLDGVITIFAPEAIRLERVMKRDEVDEAKVRARMKAQLPESEKLKMADFVIHNDGKQMLIPQVLQVHQQLLLKATP